MRLKTYPIVLPPKEGDTKVEKRFAWWPRKVESTLIWLEWYELHFVYKVKPRAIVALHIGIFHKGTWGDWDLITEKLVKR